MTQPIALSRFAAVGVVALCASGMAQAALIDRGGGLIYDTDRNVTWLQDANYAKTSGYDADGLMTWSEATTWAANLSYHDSVRNVTYTDWRLPVTTSTDTGFPDCNWAYGGTDCGYNVNPANSEMAHLFFDELGNLSQYAPANPVPWLPPFTAAIRPGTSGVDWGLVNKGPFTNFQSDTTNYYWYGTEPSMRPDGAWYFNFDYGSQDIAGKPATMRALAVRPGDVAAVPEAETYALMMVGLGLVGWRLRRRGCPVIKLIK